MPLILTATGDESEQLGRGFLDPESVARVVGALPTGSEVHAADFLGGGFGGLPPITAVNRLRLARETGVVPALPERGLAGVLERDVYVEIGIRDRRVHDAGAGALDAAAVLIDVTPDRTGGCLCV